MNELQNLALIAHGIVAEHIIAAAWSGGYYVGELGLGSRLYQVPNGRGSVHVDGGGR